MSQGYRGRQIVEYRPGATTLLRDNPIRQLLWPSFPDARTPIRRLLSGGKEDRRVVTS